MHQLTVMQTSKSATRLLATTLIFAASVGCASGGPESLASPDDQIDDSAAAVTPAAAPPLADQIAQQFELSELPTVEAVRVISQDEIGPVLDQCLVGKGFPAMSGDVADDQASAWHLAMYECASMYPVDPKYQEPFSRDQLETLHSYYSKSLIPCLADQGLYPASPPSLDTFVGAWGTSAMYTPYGSILSATVGWSESKHADLEKLCPQYPPDEILYPA